MVTVLQLVGSGSRLPWIELCQSASVDPKELVEAYVDLLLPKLMEASQVKFLSRVRLYFS